MELPGAVTYMFGARAATNAATALARATIEHARPVP
jgi:hypothetical protein